jgi:outer membrane protein OmpA-like peptidoglycan-associated protein
VKAERARVRCWWATGAVILAAILTGCGLVPVNRAEAARMLKSPAARSSELIVITDQGTPTAMKTTAALLIGSVRAGERVIVIGDRGGVLLGSSMAPAPPSMQAPDPPTPLPADPTSFQKARYSQAAQRYQEELQQAQQSLRNRQHAQLAAWIQGVAAQAVSRARRLDTGPPGIAASLGEAAGDLSSLRQSGSGSAVAATIVIIGVNSATALSAPSVSASLQGSTVVVDDFPGTDDGEAAWQAALDQSGAERTVVLTPATDNQLTATVQQGLDGAAADTLTSILFGLGRSTLEPAALPQLRRLLHLLTVIYPEATATIDGYTDNLPAAGGNLQLSLRRAQAVSAWLVTNNVPARRLQAVGCGDTDPVAQNTPDGQPLNRRVVVIIDPATDTLSAVPRLNRESPQSLSLRLCERWVSFAAMDRSRRSRFPGSLCRCAWRAPRRGSGRWRLSGHRSRH